MCLVDAHPEVTALELKKKSSWIPITLALLGPIVVFYLLLVVSAEVAKRTPEDQLPTLSRPVEHTVIDSQLYLTVIVEESPNGDPIQGASVRMVREVEVDGELVEQMLTTTTDSSGTATFSVSKRGRLMIGIMGWGDGVVSEDGSPLDEAIHEAIENHPDEILVQRFHRSGSSS
ncbi:MAG: hypothetical protein JJU11_17505 [Candidatus Sumerlaeia bacterium]|nr:hypothetical protein [Candidatus Sumerlaeia bacterium]